MFHCLFKIISKSKSCRDAGCQPAARPTNGRHGQSHLAKLLPLRHSFFQQIIHAIATLKVSAFNKYGGRTKTNNRIGEGVQIMRR